jgi:BNR/Asp-box repeat protein
MRRASVFVVVSVLVLVAFAVGPLRRTAPSAPTRADASGEQARAEGPGNPDAQEQADMTAEHLEAAGEAKSNGTFGVTKRVPHLAAAGWAGESVFDPNADDWEPAVAADTNAPYVYMIATHFGAKPCSGNCPVPWMALRISKDGGKTFGTAKPLCACKGSWQYDPIIEVVKNTGAVYAAYLNGFNTVFVKSTDHGKTWSRPVSTFGNVSWTDKPVLTTSASGRDVYISFNGPTGGDPWMAVSHDFGATWTQTQVADSSRYYFAYDAAVLPDGTVIFSEGSIDYSGPGTTAVGTVEQRAFVSKDNGATWTNILVDTVPVGEPCTADGCTSDFYLGHSGVSADAGGTLTYVYDGATVDQGPQRIWVRRSTNDGLTWGPRTALSVDGEEATSPAVESTGNGDIRVWYMQTNNGNVDAWNVWYRSSKDGGTTWTAPVKISDATGGAAYKTPQGFQEVYGDYGEIAITDTGKTFAVWGEGTSWTGPGGVWWNRQN